MVVLLIFSLTIYLFYMFIYRYSDALSGEKLHGETFERNKLCVLYLMAEAAQKEMRKEGGNIISDDKYVCVYVYGSS